jgi:hypothetical protein
VVLQGSEAKQQKEKYTVSNFRTSNYIFTQTVTGKVAEADEPTTENRIVKTWASSNAPFRCEHHKATASGGGTFTCSTRLNP